MIRGGERMLDKAIIKTITLGHSQHGKSTIAGRLYLGLIDRHADFKSREKLKGNVYERVERCMVNYNYGNNLRYALIFDGMRKDVYADKRSKFKTFTTKPYTLAIDNEKYIELTDLPGHQSFLRRICGAIETSNIGLFVLDAVATAKCADEGYLSEITELTVLRGNPKGSAQRGTAPYAYRMMLDGRQREARRKEKHSKSSETKDLNTRTIRDRMHPSVLSGIFNYICLAWHLGIRQFIFVVHKMDLVGYKESEFLKVKALIELLKTGIDENSEIHNGFFQFIPTAMQFSHGFGGDTDHNIVNPSKDFMPWYKGKTLIETFEETVDKASDNYMARAEDDAFRFQINSSKGTRAGARDKYFKPKVWGYLFSGHLKDDDKIYFSLRNTEDPVGPVRVSLHKQKTKTQSENEKLLPHREHHFYLNESDLRDIRKGMNIDIANILYLGNYAFKDATKEGRPIIVSNKIRISFSFVGGWMFKECFNANLIYGYNRVDARFTMEDIDESLYNRCKAVVKLQESIPFCNFSNEILFGKAVIEKNTFVVGVGTVTEIISERVNENETLP
jgi:translation elongation factor EF-1alpha